MDIHQQVIELLTAQDRVRQVYIRQTDNEKAEALRQLDRHMSKVINQIGRSLTRITENENI